MHLHRGAPDFSLDFAWGPVLDNLTIILYNFRIGTLVDPQHNFLEKKREDSGHDFSQQIQLHLLNKKVFILPQITATGNGFPANTTDTSVTIPRNQIKQHVIGVPCVLEWPEPCATSCHPNDLPCSCTALMVSSGVDQGRSPVWQIRPPNTTQSNLDDHCWLLKSRMMDIIRKMASKG